MTPKHQRWEGCYDQQWAGVITPESMAHPAKFSRGLIDRIYRHCLEAGYLKRGDLVGDCFGGIGTGGIMAAYAGLRWVGVELEPRFVSYAVENFTLHRDRLQRLGFPQPQILLGDSRQFDRLVGQACGVVSSPPFADVAHGTKGSFRELRAAWNQDPKNAGKPGFRPNQAGEYDTASTNDSYGTSPGQIGALPAGNVAGVISSPPFTQGYSSGGGINVKGYGTDGKDKVGDRTYQGTGGDRAPGNIETLPAGDLAAVVSSPPYAETELTSGGEKIRREKRTLTKLDGYGTTEGNIGRLKGGELQAVVSSPPYETNVVHGNHGLKLEKFKDPKRVGVTSHAIGKNEMQRYGETEGNIGNGGHETYWQAVRDVYAACWRAIKPGGVMVLVTKDYVKSKKRVPLSDDTVTLCQSLGFRLIERIQAMLVSETRHPDLFNGEDVKTKSRKSFFRRLSESKGSPKIDNEDVLIFSRP